MGCGSNAMPRRPNKTSESRPRPDFFLRCLRPQAFEHEVFNDGSEERVVLLFDLWHWELSAGERVAIQAMFRQVSEAGQRRREREESADSS